MDKKQLVKTCSNCLRCAESCRGLKVYAHCVLSGQAVPPMMAGCYYWWDGEGEDKVKFIEHKQEV